MRAAIADGRRDFNPLPPRGGRQARFFTIRGDANISTHSLLAEGDACPWCRRREARDFNPLPPRGGRLYSLRSKRTSFSISTHSLLVEGDLVTYGLPRCFGDISTHSLLAEGDGTKTVYRIAHRNFNPLPPRGGRRCRSWKYRDREWHFNPLPPRGGRRYRR